MKVPTRFLLIGLGLVGLLAVALRPSPAAVSAAGTTTLTLSTSSGPSGSQVTLTGSGYPVAWPIYVLWNGTTIGTVSANGAGELDTQVTIPSAAPGTYTIVARPLTAARMAVRPTLSLR